MNAVSNIEDRISLSKEVTLGGSALKEYIPTKFLKGRPNLFNISEVTFFEMLYLSVMDNKGFIHSHIPFRDEFLSFLERKNAPHLVFKDLKRNCHSLVLESYLLTHSEDKLKSLYQ